MSLGISCASTASIAWIILMSSLGNFVRSCADITSRNLPTSGKSPTGNVCVRCTWSVKEGRLVGTGGQRGRWAGGMARVAGTRLEKVVLEVGEQFRLCLLLAEHGGHLFLEVAHDVGMRLGEPHPLDELVDLRGARRRRNRTAGVRRVWLRPGSERGGALAARGTLRTAAFLGTFFRSVSRSRISISKSWRDHSEPRSGCSQKEPI